MYVNTHMGSEPRKESRPIPFQPADAFLHKILSVAHSTAPSMQAWLNCRLMNSRENSAIVLNPTGIQM
ncbi:hypothetical protein XELAEV_18027992mg [Xenopus laevis]|uniref:Uncharacterized protein n=1 Tax=Xenopus laevis TaxID=8355 RepID=A0A974CWG0_XENLA|nr:hypothetical protein XELAEV_18027992mg [Xenopus laevis]